MDKLNESLYSGRNRASCGQQVPRCTCRREVCACAERIPARSLSDGREEADDARAGRVVQRRDQLSRRPPPPRRVVLTVRPYDGRTVLLGVTGGIASYKSAWLARLLTKAG